MNHKVGKESRPARGKQGRSPRLYIRGVVLMEVRKSNLWALRHSGDGGHDERKQIGLPEGAVLCRDSWNRDRSRYQLGRDK